MTEINNTTKAKISTPLVKKLVAAFLCRMKLEPEPLVSIVFVGDKKIKQINSKYRKRNRITDVLAFSNLEGGQIAAPKGEPPYLGEVIICYPQAKRQAKEQGHSVKKEVTILLIHGLLHLLGYEHDKRSERMIMQRLEKELLVLV
ncbi:rRNA maturation RNase YbeY [Patescibacteria group bacterium]|nr:rRNA maturation RNase YbeY [Patescibacteria group bacterium]MBU4511833.1 rRNA maturation RNase YbeY [Patescibacteria group bacterium]MCG2693436.1 rRNA maturation RNase YbeY [Candidatus Parcubacteria bacterium]